MELRSTCMCVCGLRLCCVWRIELNSMCAHFWFTHIVQRSITHTCRLSLSACAAIQLSRAYNEGIKNTYHAMWRGKNKVNVKKCHIYNKYRNTYIHTHNTYRTHGEHSVFIILCIVAERADETADRDVRGSQIKRYGILSLSTAIFV